MLLLFLSNIIVFIDNDKNIFRVTLYALLHTVLKNSHLISINERADTVIILIYLNKHTL